MARWTNGLRSIIHISRKMRNIIISTRSKFVGRNAISPLRNGVLPYMHIIFIIIILFSSESPAYSDPTAQIYKTGTTFLLIASRFGLSAEGVMDVLENTKFRDEDVILVRSRITKMGGLMGFIIKFLRIYKESNTFDSYINSKIMLTSRYEVYKLNNDGSKKLTEHVYFDRANKNAISLQDNQIIASDIAPDTQDAFSNFLSILRRINTDKLTVGKIFEINLYAYKKTHKVNIEVTDLTTIDRTNIYTLMLKDLPAIFTYPASVEIKVTNVDGGFLFPVYGKCVIHIPILPDVTVEGRLSQVK